MDFGKLSQTEKLATYGAVATLVGGLVAAASYLAYGIAWIGVLAAIAMLVVIFLPQLSPSTTLPGSRGSLMLVAGGVGAVALVLALLTTLGFIFRDFGLPDIFFLVAVAGAILMGWAAWQAFQAEGGNFTIGTGSKDTPGAGADSAAPREEPAASPPPQGAAAPDTEGTDPERRNPPA